MYNRYIPQPDGSYRRSRMPDQSRPVPPPPRPPEPVCPEPKPEPQKPEPVKQLHCPPPRRVCHPPRHHQTPPQKQEAQQSDASVTSFLRRLLPKDFDTGDLMIVLLLLLMAGDCAEDQNTALLTLALYFFM